MTESILNKSANIGLPINLPVESIALAASNLYQMTQTGISTQALCTAALDTLLGGFMVPKVTSIACDMISRATGVKSDLLYLPMSLTTQVLYEKAKNKILNEDRNHYHETVLMTAARTCKLSLVKACLQGGANVNAIDNVGNTSLMLAVAKGNLPIVNVLVQAGADVNTINNDNFTPLLLAAGRGYTEIVNVLIQAGANIDYIDQFGNTPLFYATENQHGQTIELLNIAQENQEISKIRSDMFDILKCLVQDQSSPPACITFLDLPIEIRMLILSKREYPEWYKPYINRDLHFALNKVNKMLTNRQEKREEQEEREERLKEIGFNFLFNL